jgi:hypothetical protein
MSAAKLIPYFADMRRMDRQNRPNALSVAVVCEAVASMTRLPLGSMLLVRGLIVDLIVGIEPGSPRSFLATCEPGEIEKVAAVAVQNLLGVLGDLGADHGDVWLHHMKAKVVKELRRRGGVDAIRAWIGVSRAAGVADADFLRLQM